MRIASDEIKFATHHLSTMTSAVVGVAVRALVNVLCLQNEKLAASALGLWDGLSIYQAHLDNSLLDIGTLLQLALGLLFDFIFFGSIVRTVTYALGCFLGILVGDFGPDLWYDLGGEDISKDFRRELNTLLSYLPLVGDDERSSHRRRRSRSRSPATSVGRKSEGETTVRQRPSTAGTSRRRRSTRQLDDQSTVLTRDSRVTFDETSITQSQTEDSSVDDGGEGLYMEPSTAASHLGVRSPAQSLLRRMYEDDDEDDTDITQVRRRSLSSLSRSGGGDTTPRGNPIDLDTKPGESSSLPNPYSNMEMPVPSPVARVGDVLGSFGGVTQMPEPFDGDSASGDDAGTIDVRGLPREVATERIEQRWREIRSRGGYTLRILVPDEEDSVSDTSDHPSFFKFRLLDHMKRQGFDARFDAHTPGVVIVTALFSHR